MCGEIDWGLTSRVIEAVNAREAAYHFTNEAWNRLEEREDAEAARRVQEEEAQAEAVAQDDAHRSDQVDQLRTNFQAAGSTSTSDAADVLESAQALRQRRAQVACSGSDTAL